MIVEGVCELDTTRDGICEKKSVDFDEFSL